MADPVAYLPDGTPVADDQLHQAVASGNARFKGGERVHFVDSNGTHFSVPGEQAWEQIKRGNKPLTSGEFEHYQAVKQAGESGTEALKTTGTGLARSLTLGLSDTALEALSPGYAQSEAIRQEAHPEIKTAAEIAGYALPIAGELGIGGRLIKGATAIPRGLSAVARAGGSVAERAAGKIGKLAVEGAIEGAGYNTGNQISESTIHDEPLTAQNLLFAAGEGAKLGGALGGILGGFTKLAEKGAAKIAAPAAEGVERTGLKELAAGTEPKSGGVMNRLKSIIGDTAEEQATGQAWKTVGANGSDIARIEAKEAGGKAASARMANRIVDEAGIGVADDLHTISAKVENKLRETGALFDGMQDELNARGVKMDARRVVENIEENVLAPLRSSPLNAERRLAERLDNDYVDRFRKIVTGKDEEYAAQLKQKMSEVSMERAGDIERQLMENGIDPSKMGREVRRTLRAQSDDIRKEAETLLEPWRQAHAKPEIDFNELRKLRGSIDKAIDNEKAKLTARPDQLSKKQIELKNLRNEIEGSIGKQLEEVSPAMAKQYSEAKLAYRDWNTIAKVARKRAAAESGHRSLGLLGSVHTTTGAVLGGGIGALAGAGLGYLAKTPGASLVASKAFRGISEGISGLATRDAIKEAAEASGRLAEKVDAASAKHAVSVPQMREAAAYAVPVALARGAASAMQVAEKAQQAVSNPEYQRQTELATLESSPGLQREIMATQAAALKTIADISPHPDQVPNPSLGDNQPPPDNARAKEYARAIELLEHPAQSLAAGLELNGITRKDVALLKAIAPEAFKGFAGKVIQASLGQIKKGKSPSYQHRLQIGIIAGIPMDSTDTPQFTQSMQLYYQQSGSAQAPQQRAANPNTHTRAPELASREATFSQKLVDEA